MCPLPGMYDTMQVHEIVSIKLKYTSNARYLKMDYTLKMYFQRAAIKTVAIIGVPHQIVGTINFIPSVGTGRPGPPGEGSAKGEIRQKRGRRRRGPGWVRGRVRNERGPGEASDTLLGGSND